MLVPNDDPVYIMLVIGLSRVVGVSEVNGFMSLKSGISNDNNNIVIRANRFLR
jgi:hypothetical protein